MMFYKYGIITPVITVLVLYFMIKFEYLELPKGKERKSFKINVSLSDSYMKKKTDLKTLIPLKKSFFKMALARNLNDKIAEYVALKPSDKDSIQHEMMEVKNSTVLIYNRINKSGSTSISSETK